MIPATGFFKIWRSLLHSDEWRNSTPAHKAVLMTIIAKVNHKACEWWDASTGKKIILQPGSFTTSNRVLAEDAEVSIKAVRNALRRLSAGAQPFITVKAQRWYSLITVCNWTYWQCNNGEGHNPEGGAGAQQGIQQGTQPGVQQGVRQGVHNKEGRRKKEEETDLSNGLPVISLVMDWNEMASKASLASVRGLTKKRMAALRVRWKDADWREIWQDAIKAIPDSPFLCGSTGWRITLDTFLKPDTATKIMEGAYGKGRDVPKTPPIGANLETGSYDEIGRARTAARVAEQLAALGPDEPLPF